MCDQLVAAVKNTIGLWKAGKFMPLTMHPHSNNSYTLSKVWYHCSSINLRISDCTAITSQVKQWLYLLQKPSELVLYHQCNDGGLGLLSVKVWCIPSCIPLSIISSDTASSMSTCTKIQDTRYKMYI